MLNFSYTRNTDGDAMGRNPHRKKYPIISTIHDVQKHPGDWEPFLWGLSLRMQKKYSILKKKLLHLTTNYKHCLNLHITNPNRNLNYILLHLTTNFLYSQNL